ncbi:YhgE/Pip domain-containing protein [Lactococcus fujiensis]|nr:YhgE/Pip domain-containing protein [Lactococcus fujiensis]
MLKNEWEAILKHKFFIVVILALALVPAIYNYIFLGSMWDPYGNLDKLPVAVVNLDKSSELDGKTLKLGDSVVTELKKTKNLDYHFVSEKEASEGIKSGKYYLKITFPKEFSTQAASLMTNNPKNVQIDYQTTAGHNYISSKMSESAMNQLKSEISSDITKQYTEAIFASLTTLKSGMKDAATGSSKLADGATSAKSGSQKISSHLDTLAKSSLTFEDGANSLSVGLNQYLSGVDQVSEGAKTLSSGTQNYTSGVNQAASGANDLATGTKQFSSATNKLATGTQTLADQSSALTSGLSSLQSKLTEIQQLQTGSQALTDGLSDLTSKTSLSAEQKQQIEQLESGLTQINQAIQTGSTDPTITNQVKADLANVEAILTNSLVQNQVAAVEQTTAFQSLSANDQKQITDALGASAQASLAPITASLKDVETQLTTLSGQSTELATNANTVLPAATQTLSTLSSGMEQTNSALSSQILPGATKVSTGVSQLNDALKTGSSQLSSGASQLVAGINQINNGAQQISDQSKTLDSGTNTLASGLNQLQANSSSLNSGSIQLVAGLNQLQTNNSTLSSGSSQLASGANQIASGSNQLASGSSNLTSGLLTLSNGTTHLADSLGDANKELAATNSNKNNAKAIASPLTTKHTDTSNVHKNGVGMAPYMICVALFIGALSTNVVIGTSFSGKSWKTGREFMLAKIGTNGVVALLQALVVYGAVSLLGLTPNYPIRTLFAIILISFAFMAIATFFVNWLGAVGDFILIILLVLQLATSAGTYPLQLSSNIFQSISPWLPMTYGLKMLRETIGLSGNITIYAIGFIILIAVFTGLLSVFKRISRFA